MSDNVERTDESRDAWLREALRHAPDAQEGPPRDLREAILREARRAARPGFRPSWSDAWSWLARPPVAAALATVMLATALTVAWRSGGFDEPPRDASVAAAPPPRPVPPAAPEPAPAAPLGRLAKQAAVPDRKPAVLAGRASPPPAAQAPAAEPLPPPTIAADAASPGVAQGAAPAAVPAPQPAAAEDARADARRDSEARVRDELFAAKERRAVAAPAAALQAPDPLLRAVEVAPEGAPRWALDDRRIAHGPVQRSWLLSLRQLTAGRWLPATGAAQGGLRLALSERDAVVGTLVLLDDRVVWIETAGNAWSAPLSAEDAARQAEAVRRW